MPLNPQETQILVQAMLTAYEEDIDSIAKLIRVLRTTFPAIDWIDEISTAALAWQPFFDSGLSVQWWLDELDRQSTP